MASNEELSVLIRQLSEVVANQNTVITQLMRNPADTGVTASNPEIQTTISNSITEFCFDPDAEVYFESWYNRYEQLFKVDGQSLDDAAKVRILLRKVHSANFDKYSNYILPKSPKDFSFDETIANLTKIFGPQKTLFRLRYECFLMEKQNSEDFVSYAARINRQCEKSKLSNLTLEQFKCLFYVCGLRSSQNSDTRTRLLSKIENDTDGKLILSDLVDDCQQVTNLRQDTNMIEHKNSSVKAVSNQKSHNQKKTSPSPNQQANSAHSSSSVPRKPCWNCGAMHFSVDCSYKEHKCKQCNRMGHKEGYCNCFSNKPIPPKQANNKNAQNHNKKFTKGIFSVHNIELSSKRKFITVSINDVVVKLQLDTASDITIISKSTWQKIGEPVLANTNHIAKTASGEQLDIIAKINCNIKFQDDIMSGECYVVKVPDLNIMGIDWIEKFGLWNFPFNQICNQVMSKTSPVDPSRIEELISKFPDVFTNSLGCCKKTQIVIYTKPNAKPVFRAKRPVAYASLEKIDEELQRLQQLGIITPVDFSNWAAPIVVVKKSNGSIRICADYSTGLNEVLEPHQFPLPLPEDVISKISNGSIFSQLDLSDAFLQVEVAEESRELLTINTHRGLFRFNRLPPGIKSAPGAFQQIMSTMVGDLDGAAAYLDDIIVSGKTEADHQQNLYKVLKRVEEFGFHLQIEKCSFYMKSIKYLGYIVDKEGIRPDQSKVDAITKMPPPKDITSLQSYLGAINFYGKFIKDMHQLRKPLDDLLSKNSIWNWTPACQQSFDSFKNILKSDLMLTHFNPSMDIIVAADASNTGIGACLFHKFPDKSIKAVYHASRTLTKAERNYSQIEKEALGLIFAVTKFHRMIFGRKFTLQTDHKPLLAIFGSKKGIPVYTANRLQRWALTLLLYDFHIEYISTKHFGYVDILSRLIDSQIKPDEDYVIASVHLEEDLSYMLNESIGNIPLTFGMIRDASKECESLQRVMQYINTGWPQTSKDISDEQVKKFYHRKNGLTIVKDCVMFGERIVIPSVFQKKVLNQLHHGHQGMERMKTIARSYVYWPNIDDDIQNTVKSCSKCISAAKSPIKVDLESWPIPQGPWRRIHIDYAGPQDGHNFLVIIDAYSKWPEIYHTNSTTASATINILDKVFAQFGLPELIVSDNGTQFVSSLFREYCQANGIQHIRSAPYHPQSNGQAERFVDTLKRALKKINGGGKLDEALQVFLQTYRSTSNKNSPDGKSPAEIMLGRKMRIKLDLMLPNNLDIVQVPANLEVQKKNQSEQFNKKHSTRKRSFEPGDKISTKVYSKHHFQWHSGKVIERVGKVMYNILLDNNNHLTRVHINQLRERLAVPDASCEPISLPLDVLLDTYNLGSQNKTTTSIGDVTSPPTSDITFTTTHHHQPQLPPRAHRHRVLPSHLKDYVLF